MRHPDQPYHHGDLRAALLERAVEQLRTGSPADLSLRRLARDLGVSHAAPSRHFPDRQAFLAALAAAGWQRLDAELAAADPGPDAGLRPRVLALGRGYVRFATTEPALLELVFARKGAGEAPHAADAVSGPALVVADAQRRGEVVPGDPGALATALWAGLHGVAALSVSGALPGTDVDALLVRTVDTLLDGLRPR
ncbi:TetR/AcrR family transcriptional regulator [Geodermatophilus sp. DSM 44513]|uniref:TetR/AcrR family transcriptional regulator n=1 Tax=Geodermatophilus sp. DSM 44513 TaxID=1528104 RepID=UPI001271FF7B|nr:TetR-like C-terminal domain-containing protein [Geodermatophilus sp. DSM 44513]WNV74034.1 TetR-like C-terminal domain-containing protein [Geodermatophilus sp. DSM 44513]